MLARARTQGGQAPAWLRWVTRVSLVFGVIALVATVWMVGPAVLMTHLEMIGPWFAVLIAIELVITLCDAGVVHAMSRGAGAPSYRQVCVAQFAGRAVNSVTPGAALGDALRVSLLARECPTQRIVAAVVFASIGQFVTGLAIVAAGTIATALMFAMPVAAEVILLAVGIATAAVVVGTLLLVRRGMLSVLARIARRLRVISEARHERWRDQLADIDRRLRGDDHNEHRTRAMALICISQLLQRGVIWIALLAAGYSLDAAQLIAVLSAGVLLTWISALVPMGVGVSEGGNGVLFALIGAPTSLGVALAFARRVNQILFAALGFSVLAADRIADKVDDVDALVRQPQPVTR